MARITTALLLLVVLLNGATGIMAASGLSDDIGIEATTGVGTEIDSIQNDIQDAFSADTSVVESLILLFLELKDVFAVVIQGAFAAPSLFMNLGFPSWIVLPMFAPMYFVSVIELASVVTGRRTI